MNKRGYEFTAVNAMELAFLAMLIILFSLMAYRGVEDQKLNEIKAGDLGLAIDSVYLVDNPIEVRYNFGEEENTVEVNGNNLKVYRDSEIKMGVSELMLDENYDFTEQVNGKIKIIKINKDGRRIVVS